MTLYGEDHAGNGDKGDLNTAEHIQAPPQMGQHPVKANQLAPQFFIFSRHFTKLISLPAKSPHHTGAGQIFLNDGENLALLGFQSLGFSVQFFDEPQGIQQDQRSHHEGQQRQGKV